MCKQWIVLAVTCLLGVSAAAAAKDSRCYTCSGINCLRTTALSANETCVYNQDECVTIFDKFAVVAKGCFSSMPIELRRKCDDRASPECRTCNGALCNSLGRSDFKCYECSSKDDAKCASNLSAFEPVQCKAPTSPNSYCFTDVTSDGYIQRGCSLHVKQQRECLASAKCSLCLVEDAEACNNLPRDKDMHSSGVPLSGVAGLVAICAVVLFRL